MIKLKFEVAEELEREMKVLNWVDIVDYHEFMHENKDQIKSANYKLLELSPTELSEALFFGYEYNV